MISTATWNRPQYCYLSNHPPFLGSPVWGRNLVNNSYLVFSTQRIHPVARVLELPTCPSLSFRVFVSTQEVREEALLNMRCIVKGYHLCRFEVNFGEVFTANKKRGECGNAFKVVNHRGQLGHLQSELEDPRYQLISIYLSIIIQNRYQSVTTRLFTVDWSSIININQLIDIDWY